MEYPHRKQIRSRYIDYSKMGVYFITVSTAPRCNHFWMNPGKKYDTPDAIELNEIGKVAEHMLLQIPAHYPHVLVDAYVIMPDHIHLLLRVLSKDTEIDCVRKSISTVINQWKGIVTKTIGKSVWQKLFFDHVIRNDDDYESTLRYMYNNPLKWYYEHNSDNK